MGKSLTHKAVSGTIWSGAQRFGTMGVSFLSNMILARLLSPEDFGCIGMLTIFIAISATFVDGGFGNALIQKKNPTEADYSTVFFWNIILSVVLYSFLFFAAPYIATFYHMDVLCNVLRIEGLTIIINTFYIIQSNQLRKQLQFKKLAVISFLAALVSFVVAIFMAFKGYGVWSLVWQQLSLSIFSAIFFWVFCSWRPKILFSIKSFRELFGFGAFMMSSTLLNTVFNNLNGLLIGRFFNAATMGYFSQAKKIEDVSSTAMIGVVEQVTYPILSEVQNDFQRMRNILKRLNSTILYTMMPLMLLIILLAKPIIVLLFSPKWIPAVPYLQILCIQGVVNCLQGINYNAIAAIGKSRLLFKWTVVKRFLGIVLLLVGVCFGLYGILWSMVLSSIIVCVINDYLVAKYLHYSFQDQMHDILPVMLLGTTTFLIAFGVSHILNLNMYISAVVVFLIFLTVYILLSYILSISAYNYTKKTLLNIYGFNRLKEDEK